MYTRGGAGQGNALSEKKEEKGQGYAKERKKRSVDWHV